jgi:hypothetical protein
MTTTTLTSPGTYYHRHVKPLSTNSHLPLDGINADKIPNTACRIAVSSWLLATEYAGKLHCQRALDEEPGTLTVWINASKSQLPNGAYYGMRIANVAYHHVGALHGFGRKKVPREPTSDELVDQLKGSLV